MISDDVAALERKCYALERACEGLVKMYVANLGTPHEFISCITPPHASQMTKKQRAESKHWAAWDAARAALKLNS